MANTTVTKPTLTYFNMAALGEVPRLILEEAGVDYDYVTMTNWAELKPEYVASGKAAFGQLPLYEEPGVTLVQRNAITRYLAKKHGFAGTNDVEAALIDVANEGVADIIAQVVVFFRSPEDRREEIRQKIITEFLPTQLEYFAKLLEKNGNNGFLVGSKLSYADLALWTALNLISNKLDGTREVVEKLPSIKAFLDGVAARDKIKAYLARDVYAKKD